MKCVRKPAIEARNPHLYVYYKKNILYVHLTCLGTVETFIHDHNQVTFVVSLSFLITSRP